jgi:predicted nucleotidyltransferase
MRLKQQELDIIKQSAIKFFGDSSHIYIFGSRVDDAKKGGDIDIFIETNKNENILESKIKFLVELEKKLGEQKIDLIVKNINSDENLPVYDIAKRQGVRL